ncbi:MAG: cytochrome ubiquinol oxidase subunit I, partial [Solirubrobacterales bacterium]|nr:cytochrome ubiquinol oxidase subunit I [Solirubrobacterales bacterium]
NGDETYRRLARFFGALLLINVAIGVVTGLIQEFEFGMNWSAYSRVVGDVFGAPLAMEGLAAFFLESTFLGLWMFGWDRLPKRLHLACIWLVAIGSMLSAAFILAANSWMQHPVGYSINSTTHQPQLNNVLALFTNPTFLWGYVHVILAALVTGCVVMLAVSAWYLRRGIDVNAFKRSAHLAIVVLIPALGLALFVGSELGVVEAKYQPVKIAAAEAQWTTCKPCSFSMFQIGGGNNDQTPSQIIAIPYLLSFLATNSFQGQVVGLTPLQQQYQKQYGAGNYIPNVFIQYWSMRVMAYLAAGLFLLALWGGWLVHTGKLQQSRWFLRLAGWVVVVPFLMNTAGWMLTENGRQPWIVQGLMKTTVGVSPSVSATEIWISLIVFVSLYIALGAADVVLMMRYAQRGLPAEAPSPEPVGGADRAIPKLAY